MGTLGTAWRGQKTEKSGKVVIKYEKETIAAVYGHTALRHDERVLLKPRLAGSNIHRAYDMRQLR